MSRISHQDFRLSDQSWLSRVDGTVNREVRIIDADFAVRKLLRTKDCPHRVRSASYPNGDHMVKYAAFPSLIVTATALDIAKLRLIFRKQIRQAALIFRTLWDASQREVLMTELLELLPPNSRGTSRVWDMIEYLSQVFRQRRWPLRLSFDGAGFRLERLDQDWNWRDLVPDEMAFCWLALPNSGPNEAKCVGALLRDFGKVVPMSEISASVRGVADTKPCRYQVSTAFQKARRSLTEMGSGLEIKFVGGVGYRLGRARGGEGTELDFLGGKEGELSLKRIGSACTFLGTSAGMLGLVFLVLWDRRNETLSHDWIAERCEDYTGTFCSLGALQNATKKIRQILEVRDCGADLLTHINVGYQLQTSRDRFYFPMDRLGHRSGLGFLEQRAQLATLLPDATAAELTVLQIHRQHGAAPLSRSDIRISIRELLGTDTTERAVRCASGRVRRRLQAVGASVSLSGYETGLGQWLDGDVDAWLAGRDELEGAEVSQFTPVLRRAGRYRSRSVPMYKCHGARSFGPKFD